MFAKIILISMCCLGSTIQTQSKPKQDELIGKRYDVMVGNNVVYSGIVSQVSNNFVVLSSALKKGGTCENSVPFLNNIRNRVESYEASSIPFLQNRAKAKPGCEVVIPVSQIESLTAVKVKAKSNPAMQQSPFIKNIQRMHLSRINSLLSSDEDLSKEERDIVLREIDALRAAVGKE